MRPYRNIYTVKITQMTLSPILNSILVSVFLIPHGNLGHQYSPRMATYPMMQRVTRTALNQLAGLPGQ